MLVVVARMEKLAFSLQHFWLLGLLAMLLLLLLVLQVVAVLG
jgi:hypothetical protein